MHGMKIKNETVLSGNVYSRENLESWGLRLHVPVVNGTFLQRKKILPVAFIL
jgi:hypothetical protein